jgi:hypothetical protein
MPIPVSKEFGRLSNEYGNLSDKHDCPHVSTLSYGNLVMISSAKRRFLD